MNCPDKFVIEADAGEPDVEDGGMARILHIESPDPNDVFFVRLQSYDESQVHATIKNFEGKKLRVTVEIL
jgi:hypothetical protein